MAKTNLIQKINKMDRKQAYTIGAIVIVVFIVLLTLASFFGKTDDSSFDDFSSRGYDLAQMPFVNDEAEAYLLASKYPDMQDNDSSLLYSPEEKEERQEEDEENYEDENNFDEGGDYEGDGGGSYSPGAAPRSYRGYGGRGGGSGTPTTIGSLGSANVATGKGSGSSDRFGAPRGDFSPYKSQDKGKEIPAQLRNTDARKALKQFAQLSRAAAGLQGGKGANAKRALMGGNVTGGDAFTERGVDLSKAGGLRLDTNAPEAAPDLSDLEHQLDESARSAQQDNQEEQSLWDKLLETLMTGITNLVVNAAGKAVENWIDKAFKVNPSSARGSLTGNNNNSSNNNGSNNNSNNNNSSNNDSSNNNGGNNNSSNNNGGNNSSNNNSSNNNSSNNNGGNNNSSNNNSGNNNSSNNNSSNSSAGNSTGFNGSGNTTPTPSNPSGA